MVVAWLLPVVLLPVVAGGGGGGVAAVAGGGVVAGEDVHLPVVVHLQLPVHGVPAQLLNTDRRWLDGRLFLIVVESYCNSATLRT